MIKTIAYLLSICLLTASMVLTSCSKEKEGTAKSNTDTAVEVAKKPLVKTQATDAISGQPIDRSVYTDYNGKRIYFCCVDSRSDFLSNPEKYLQVFRSKGVELEETPPV